MVLTSVLHMSVRILGKTSCSSSAESRRWELKQTLANARFFSLLLEGSIDVGNVDDEVFLAVYGAIVIRVMRRSIHG